MLAQRRVPLLAEAGAGALRRVAGGDAHKFTNATGKGHLAIVRDMVGNLAMQMSPQIGADRTNPFFQEVLARLPFFIAQEVDSLLPDRPKRLLQGRPALLWMLGKSQEEAREGDVTLEMLEPLNIYSFLLDPDEIAAVEALTKVCVKSVRSSLLDAPGEPAKETAPPAKRQRKVFASEAASSFFS